MKPAISRRLFLIGGGAAVTASSALKAFAYTSPLTDRPFFSMNLPPEYDAQDIAFQSFAIDSKTQTVFAQFSTRTKPQQTIIAEYELIPWGMAFPRSIQSPSSQIGHQGLTIERGAYGGFLWAAAPGHGRSAVRFKYQSQQNPTVQTFKLFNEDHVPSAITVAVSYDGNKLVAAGKKNSADVTVNAIRLFDLNDVLKLQNLDASSSAIAEWEVPLPSSLPIQGLACMGSRVFISCGDSRAKTDKIVFCYSTEGDPINSTQINMGRAGLAARSSYEPEGLGIFKIPGASEPSLMIGLTTGRAETGRTRKIYVMPDF
ncbi:hypothetical protein [Agrobacterium tumefaciens]|uniref:phage baseplate protein n=1 Tax=Agrobacterium tumefaciens TaxID=358 RepID=UPI0039A46F4F